MEKAALFMLAAAMSGSLAVSQPAERQEINLGDVTITIGTEEKSPVKPEESRTITVNGTTITIGAREETPALPEGPQSINVGGTTITIGTQEETSAQPEGPQSVTMDGVTFTIGGEDSKPEAGRRIFSEMLNGQQCFMSMVACAPENGSTMTITVSNTGSAGFTVCVTPDALYGNKSFAVPAGTTRVITVKRDDGAAMAGEFGVNLSTSSPDGIYCTIEVEQF